MSFWSSEKTFGLLEDKDIASRRHLCLLVFSVFSSLFGLLKRPKRPKKTLCDFTDVQNDEAALLSMLNREHLDMVERFLL